MEEIFRKKADKQIEIIKYEINKVTAKYGNKIPSNYKSYIQMINQISAMTISCFDNFTTMLSVQQLQTLFGYYNNIVQDLVIKIAKYNNAKQQKPKVLEDGFCKLCSESVLLSNIENNIQIMREQLGTGFIGGLGKSNKKETKLFTQSQDRAFFLELQNVLQAKQRKIGYQQSKIQQYIDQIATSINQMEQLKKFEPQQAKNADPIDQRFSDQIQQYFMNRFQAKIPPWLTKIFDLFKKIEKERILKNYQKIHSNRFVQTDDWQPPELVQKRKQLQELSKNFADLERKSQHFNRNMEQLQKSKQLLKNLIQEYQAPGNKKQLNHNLSFSIASTKMQSEHFKRKSDSSYDHQKSLKTQQQTLIQKTENSIQEAYIVVPQKISKYKRNKGVSSFIKKNKSDVKLPRISRGQHTTQDQNKQFRQQGQQYKIKIKQYTKTEGREQTPTLKSELLEVKSQHQMYIPSVSEYQDAGHFFSQIKDIQQQDMHISKNKVIKVEKKLSEQLNQKLTKNLPFKNRLSVYNRQNIETSLMPSGDISKLKKKKVDMSKLDKCAFNHYQKIRNFDTRQNGAQVFFKDETQKKLEILFEDLKMLSNIPSDLTLDSLKQIFSNIFEPKYKLNLKLATKLLNSQQNQSSQSRNQKKTDIYNTRREVSNSMHKEASSQLIDQQQLKKDQRVRNKAKSLLMKAANNKNIASIKLGTNQNIFEFKDLEILFINLEKAVKYEESLSQSYHKNRSVHLNKSELVFFTSLHRVQQLIKQHSKQVHKNVCAFIRYPYQSIKNRFEILNIASDLSLNTFLNYCEKILWLHRSCPKQKDSHFCHHIFKFSDKIHVILGALVKLQQDEHKGQLSTAIQNNIIQNQNCVK